MARRSLKVREPGTRPIGNFGTRKKRPQGQRLFRRGKTTLEVSGETGRVAVLTLANGQKIKFRRSLRYPPFSNRPNSLVLRVVVSGRSARLATEEEARLLNPFKRSLNARFGWRF